MNRLFKLPLLIALTLCSTQLLAVDFGQVRVLSNLGQPLLAEIPLRGASPAELENLTASLASPGEYERAGIVGGRTSVPLSFSVVAGHGGGHVIRISSSVPVDDPYLDLLVDVNTAAGKSLHEFAILLDPPSANAAPIARAQEPAPAPTAAAAPATPRAAPAAQPAATTTAAAPAPASKASGAVVKGMYGPVERGQTLSGIAQQTLPAGVDINQMLLALKQANPDAFYRDNINTLKAGAVLRVPSAADAEAMTVVAAIAEVRRQNGEWSSGDVGAPAAVANAATRSSSSGTTAASAANSGDRLALLAAKDTGKSSAGGNAAGESAAEVRRNLLQAQESLASERQQVADLQAHVKQLDDVNRKSERLLSLKDNEIAELQAKLEAARKAGFASSAPASTNTAASTAAAALATAQSAARALPAEAPVAAASSPAAALAAAGSAGVAASASSVATGANASPAPVSGAKPIPAPAAAKPAAPEQPWYMQTWAWIAGIGVVVLLILGGLLGRQGKRPVSPAAKTAPSLADSFGADAAGEPLADDVDHGELLDQLAEHPDDLGLHLQLVTLYYSRRDVEHFEAAAEAMYAHITDPQQDEWQDVVHMGEDLVPEHPLFSHQVQPPSMPAHAALGDFNIDDYADAQADADPTVVAPAMGAPEFDEAPTGYPAADVPLEFGDTDAPTGLHAVSDRLDVSPDGPVVGTAATADTDIPLDTVETASAPEIDGVDDQLGEFNDDPIDTKLDLARAYLDMGDEEGARAMLDEVLKEGSQMQKDVATGLLGDLRA
ncbi:MAG TPA: FimV/HubP family polar landmark protein [Rhodanobacter sp.]|jgi:pilus assembly protein FimV|nr:FimV/HubP family polar landmark protein [Rhodanobacter sp.]